MAQAKVEEFDKIDIDLAEFAKALAHPARVAILRKLAKQKTCICGEIVEVLPLAQSTVSQHLKELKRSGLVNGEIEGPKSCYGLNWNKLKLNFERIQGLAEDLQSSLQCC